MCQTHTPPSDRSKVTVCSPNSTTNMTAGSRAERPLHIHGSDRLCSCEGSYCAAVNTHTHTHRHRVLCLFKGQRRFTVTAVWAPGSAARCDLAPWPLVIFCYYMAEFILSKHLLFKKKSQLRFCCLSLRGRKSQRIYFSQKYLRTTAPPVVWGLNLKEFCPCSCLYSTNFDVLFL